MACLLLTLVSVSLSLSAPAAGVAPARPAALTAPEWIEATLDEALARAAREDRRVLVQLVTDWERDCGRLAESLGDEAVAAELEGLLCLSVDAEQGAGAMLAYRHGVSKYPTLLFLEPAEGGGQTLVERLQGYRTPQLMVAQLQRIARDEDTIQAMRAGLREDPGDLELRYELSRKLSDAGDDVGGRAELAEIRARDPEGRAPVSLRIGFDKLHDDFYDQLLKWEEPDWEALRAATDAIDDPILRFKGLALLALAHDVEGVRARNKQEFDDVQPHLVQSRAIYREAWSQVPEELVAVFGNELAWNFWEDADNLKAEDKAFALEACERAVDALPGDSSVLDTLACCQFMNGQVERALETVATCRELDPARSAQWDKRVAEFTAPPVSESPESPGAPGE